MVVDSLKALDPKRPIREADIVGRPRPNLPVVHLLVLVGMKAASFKGLDTPVADVARPQSNWTIRRFQRGDAPRARQLIEAVWHEHFDRHPDPFVRNFIYSRLSDIDDAETAYGDQAIFLCAVTETEIVGTGAIKRINNRECEMARMFVASPYRGRGIGRAIADELIKFALSAGYDQVRLSSNNALEASHHLYESLGFQSITLGT